MLYENDLPYLFYFISNKKRDFPSKGGSTLQCGLVNLRLSWFVWFVLCVLLYEAAGSNNKFLLGNISFVRRI